MEFIKEQLKARAAVGAAVTLLLSTGGTVTGTVAFVNDNAVGIAATTAPFLRVISIKQIVAIS